MSGEELYLAKLTGFKSPLLIVVKRAISISGILPYKTSNTFANDKYFELI